VNTLSLYHLLATFAECQNKNPQTNEKSRLSKMINGSFLAAKKLNIKVKKYGTGDALNHH